MFPDKNWIKILKIMEKNCRKNWRKKYNKFEKNLNKFEEI